MINWDEELKRIFDDPLLADVTAPKKKTTSSDRLISGFQRIVEFVEVNGRRPRNDADREERSLYNQLKGILSDSAKKSVVVLTTVWGCWTMVMTKWSPNLHPPTVWPCRHQNNSWRLSLPTRF